MPVRPQSFTAEFETPVTEVKKFRRWVFALAGNSTNDLFVTKVGIDHYSADKAGMSKVTVTVPTLRELNQVMGHFAEKDDLSDEWEFPGPELAKLIEDLDY